MVAASQPSPAGSATADPCSYRLCHRAQQGRGAAGLAVVVHPATRQRPPLVSTTPLHSSTFQAVRTAAAAILAGRNIIICCSHPPPLPQPHAPALLVCSAHHKLEGLAGVAVDAVQLHRPALVVQEGTDRLPAQRLLTLAFIVATAPFQRLAKPQQTAACSLTHTILACIAPEAVNAAHVALTAVARHTSRRLLPASGSLRSKCRTSPSSPQE